MSMGPVLRGVCDSEILHIKYNLTSGEVNGVCPERTASCFAGEPSASASGGYPGPWPRWQSGNPSCICANLPFLASSLVSISPYLSMSPLIMWNRWISLGARVHQSRCMQAKLPPPNTSSRYCSPGNPQGLDRLLSDPIGSLFKEEFMDHPDKW